MKNSGEGSEIDDFTFNTVRKVEDDYSTNKCRVSLNRSDSAELVSAMEKITTHLKKIET